MTVRSDIIADAEDIWFDVETGLAQTVTYNGTSIPAWVVFGQNPQTERSPANLGTNARYLTERAEIRVQVADVAAPAEGDTWVLAGVTWTVKSILAGNGIAWVLESYRNPRAMAGRG